MSLEDLTSYNTDLADRIRRSPTEILPLFEEAAKDVADEVDSQSFILSTDSQVVFHT